MSKLSCIYCIRNKKNNNMYIGSAIDFERRRRQHIHLLIHNKHHSRYMQREFNLFTEAVFDIYPILICDPNMLLYYEQKIIDSISPPYNSNKIAGSMLGFHHSKSSRDKMSMSKKGKKSNKTVSAAEIENLRCRSLGNNFSAKTYYNFISPDGHIIDKIYNLNEFCKQNGLDSGHMVDVYHGKRKTHKGWTVSNA